MWAQGNSTSAPPTVSSTSDFVRSLPSFLRVLSIPLAVSDDSSFPFLLQSAQGTTLLANATFPSSGNFCFNVSIPTQQSGVLSTLYVQAAGAGNNVSACAGRLPPCRVLSISRSSDAHRLGPLLLSDVAAIPNLSIASSPVIADGQEVLDPSTGQSVSYYEYYCSNSTILALDTWCVSAFPFPIPSLKLPADRLRCSFLQLLPLPRYLGALRRRMQP
jgi:hypothetical protein